MREGRSRGKEWGRKAEGQIMGMHEKIAQKPNRFGIWGRPLGATVTCHTFLKRCFRDNISIGR